MSPGRRESDEPCPPDAAFGDAISGVTPLEERDKLAPRPPASRRASGPNEPGRFHRPDPDEPALGVASGVQASQLRRLRAGRIRPERNLDLHGLRTDAARRALHRELTAAFREGVRCVLVVHGRGLHSREAGVLRKSLPEWLADPALDDHVLAFAPAQPGDGGPGASYVLLRRR